MRPDRAVRDALRRAAGKPAGGRAGRQRGGCRGRGGADGGATGFNFAGREASGLLAGLDRARARFASRNTWQRMQRTAMQRDFSWQTAARHYLELCMMNWCPASGSAMRHRCASRMTRWRVRGPGGTTMTSRRPNPVSHANREPLDWDLAGASRRQARLQGNVLLPETALRRHPLLAGQVQDLSPHGVRCHGKLVRGRDRRQAREGAAGRKPVKPSRAAPRLRSSPCGSRRRQGNSASERPGRAA